MFESEFEDVQDVGAVSPSFGAIDVSPEYSSNVSSENCFIYKRRKHRSILNEISLSNSIINR